MLYRMLANVGIKTCYIDKKTCQNLSLKPINVGKCWYKNLYIYLKSAVSAVLKEFSKTLENLR